jgi:hypothetical protein
LPRLLRAGPSTSLDEWADIKTPIVIAAAEFTIPANHLSNQLQIKNGIDDHIGVV